MSVVGIEAVGGPIPIPTPILDQLSTSSTVAFSLRKLRAAYSGKCINVRRSSDNATQDIGFTAFGDLDFVSLLSFVGGNNGFVTKWYDQSGNGADVSCGTAADQPRIVNAGVTEVNGDGVSGIFFGINNPNSQTNVCFLINSSLPANYSLADSYMVHADFEAGPGCIGGVYSQVMMLPVSGSIPQFLLSDHNTNANGIDQYGTDNGEPVYENNQNSSTSVHRKFTYGKVSTQVRWNGLGETNVTGVLIGANAINTTPGRESQSYNGWIMEFMIFPTTLGSGDKSTLFANQQNYFKISTSSPCDATDYQVTFAYSTRKIRHGYAGKCFNVRRDSDNTTQDIGFLGNGNLDTASLTSFVGAANGFVVTWYDQGPWGNNVTQATAANQPQIVSSGSVITLNGKPVLFFNNTSIATGTIGLASGTFGSTSVGTVCIVGKSNITSFPGGTGSGPVAFFSGGTWAQAWFGDGGGTTWDSNFDNNHYVSVNGSVFSSGLIGPTGNLDTWITPTTNTVYSNSNTGSKIAIGTIPSTPGFALNGYIGELFTPIQTMLASELVTLQQNMKAYWGTP